MSGSLGKATLRLRGVKDRSNDYRTTTLKNVNAIFKKKMNLNSKKVISRKQNEAIGFQWRHLSLCTL